MVPRDAGPRPELVFALVGALGTDLNAVATSLRQVLAAVHYDALEIHLSALIREIDKWKVLQSSPRDERYYDMYMDACNELRQQIQCGEAMALLAVAAIRHMRRQRDESETKQSSDRGQAFILRSLKHPDEARMLRSIYGPNLTLVSAYSPRSSRVDNLAKSLADAHHDSEPRKFRDRAERLIERDTVETDNPFGQSVRDTFPLADVFIDVTDEDSIRQSLQRFVEILFGHPYHTPTRDEYCMYHAQAAAMRSSDMGRQVGAVITTPDGDIIAVGTNEVPKPGGGLYWSGDNPDRRNFRLGEDSSDRMKLNVLVDILRRVRDAKLLRDDRSNVEDLARSLLYGEYQPAVAGAYLLNLIEFGRAVHAEMAAIVDAARRGARIQDCYLYTTTFPCHDCAKHIVAAGIRQVIYIEPYPKSLAEQLYLDSIAVDTPSQTMSQVIFRPFVGVAPRRYMEFFEMPRRKTAKGGVVNWVPREAVPRAAGPRSSYEYREEQRVSDLEKALVQVGLNDAREGERDA